MLSEFQSNKITATGTHRSKLLVFFNHRSPGEMGDGRATRCKGGMMGESRERQEVSKTGLKAK